MEITELEALESKTKAILDTLESLEKEVTEYQEKNESITYAFVSLKDASGKVAAAGRELSEAAEIFNGSDFSEALKIIDTHIGQLMKEGELITSQSGVIQSVAKQVLAANKELKSIASSLNRTMQEMLEVKQMVARLISSVDILDG